MSCTRIALITDIEHSRRSTRSTMKVFNSTQEPEIIEIRIWTHQNLKACSTPSSTPKDSISTRSKHMWEHLRASPWVFQCHQTERLAPCLQWNRRRWMRVSHRVHRLRRGYGACGRSIFGSFWALFWQSCLLQLSLVE